MASGSSKGEKVLEESESSDDDSDNEDGSEDEAEDTLKRIRRHVNESTSNQAAFHGQSSSSVCSGSVTSRLTWLPPGYVLDPTRPGNPVYGPRMQLYCRTGYHIGIFPTGRIRGIEEDVHKYAMLEVTSVALNEVRIQGLETKLFLAMNKEGKLYGEANRNEEATIFITSLLGYYNTYLSRKNAHMGWYVAIKKSGKAKHGHKTKWGQKAIQFLPRRLQL